LALARAGAGGSSELAIGCAPLRAAGMVALTDATGRLGDGSPRAAALDGNALEMANEHANTTHADSATSGPIRPKRAPSLLF